MLERTERAPASLVAALVCAATALFAWINVQNAAHLNPQWGQDLAFFHQWVHSAANGGPWASPLILEPQGFFNQVHTHLVLPLVVAVYSAVPTQNTLLVAHTCSKVPSALWNVTSKAFAKFWPRK